jgi:TP901 family phage tail tape measure protein
MAGQALTFTGKFINKMSAGLKKATKDTSKLDKATARAGKSAKATGKASGALGSGLSGAGLAAGAAAGALLALGVAMRAAIERINEGVKAAAEFETGMARIGTLLGEQASELMPALAISVDELSLAYGKAASDVQGAMFQAISAGVDAAEATAFMEVAAEAAVGGFTDMETAVDGLTSVVNAYGLSSEEARDIANSTFAANKYGKTTFKEIASSIGKVAPIAASLGVTFDELASTIVATTKAGINTKESVTGIRGALTNVIKPTDDARRLAKDLGLEFSTQAIKAKGWHQFLTDIMDATGGNTAALSTLFPNIRGLSTLMAAASQTGLKDMKEALNDMATDATKVADAYVLVANTHEQRMKQIDEKRAESGRKVGEVYKSQAEARARLGEETSSWFDQQLIEINKAAFAVGGFANLAKSALGGSYVVLISGAAKNWLMMKKVIASTGKETHAFVLQNHHLVDQLRDALAAGSDWETEIDRIKAAYAASIGMTVKQAFATGEAAQTLTEEAAAFGTSTEACMEHIGWMKQATDGTWNYTDAALQSVNSSSVQAQSFRDAAGACEDLSVATEDLTEREKRLTAANKRAAATIARYEKEKADAAKSAGNRAKAQAAARAEAAAQKEADRIANEANELVRFKHAIEDAGTALKMLNATTEQQKIDATEAAQAIDDERTVAEFAARGHDELAQAQLRAALMAVRQQVATNATNGVLDDEAEAAKKAAEALQKLGDEKDKASAKAIESAAARVHDAWDTGGVDEFRRSLIELGNVMGLTPAKLSEVAEAMTGFSTETAIQAKVAEVAVKSMVKGMASGAGQAVGAWIKGEANFGEAMAGMTRDTLLGLGQQGLANALMETAKGIAALAGVATAPLAPGHFAAAKAYAAVAAFGFAGGAAIQTGMGGGFGKEKEEDEKAETGGLSSVANAARAGGSRPGQASAGPVIINAHFSGQPLVNKAEIGKAIDDSLRAAEREGMARSRRTY